MTAATQPANAIAKRGDLCLIPSTCSATSVKPGGSYSRNIWTFSMVTNVTRDGLVSGHRDHGSTMVSKGFVYGTVLVPATKLRGLASADVLAALPREYPGHPSSGDWPKDFANPDEARDALLATLATMQPAE